MSSIAFDTWVICAQGVHTNLLTKGEPTLVHSQGVTKLVPPQRAKCLQNVRSHLVAATRVI